MSTIEAKRFVSPYEDPAPEGAEGWEELYPYYLHFREDRREFEEGRFWFADLQHWPTVFKPFDTITVEFAIKCLGQYNTRHLLIPPANGIDYRVHNGYVYMSPVAVPEAEIPESGAAVRAASRALLRRTGRRCWRTGRRRSAASSRDLEATRVRAAAETWWTSSGSRGASGWTTRSPSRTTTTVRSSSATRPSSTTSSSSTSGYVAYLDFFTFCKEALPGVADLGIAKMVQGDRRRPVPPRRGTRASLARLAVELGVADVLGSGEVRRRQGARSARGGGGQPAAGAEWVAAWEAAQDPWFNFSSGNGMYSSDRVWRDHLGIPLGFIRDYVGAAPGRARRSSARPSRSAPSATGSPPSTASCCPTTRRAPCSTASSGSGADRLSLRRGPQLLHRALVAVGVLAQDPPARRRSSPTPASGPRPTTSSTCAATSSSR